MADKRLQHKAAEIDEAVDKIKNGLDANSVNYDPNATYSPNTVGEAIKNLQENGGENSEATELVAKAEQAASNAASSLARLEDAIKELPDGQAVSAQVAENKTKIEDLGDVCFDEISYLDESIDIEVTQGVLVNSNEISISNIGTGKTIKLTFEGALDVMGRWGYMILQRKKKGTSNFVQADLITYSHYLVGYDFVVADGDDSIRLSIPANQSSASGTINFHAYINEIKEAKYKRDLRQQLDNYTPDLFGVQDAFVAENKVTKINLPVKNGDVVHYKIKSLWDKTVYHQIYAADNILKPNTLVTSFMSIRPDWNEIEGDFVVSGLTEDNFNFVYNLDDTQEGCKTSVTFSLKKGVVERVGELEEKITNVSLRGVDALKKHIELPLLMLKKKEVDETNRLVIAFNGDSIIGSQLDAITRCSTYNSGVFPPNLSKMIMARMFWDKYRFEGEDVTFRNLRHTDWQKTGFNVDKSASEITFNEFECYAPSASTDSATININVTKTTWIKVVYGYCNGGALNISITKDGSAYKTEKVGNNSNDTRLYQYKIYKVESGSYSITITPDADNFGDCRLWGCEWWSEPRLDVVVGAYSGSTAPMQVDGMINAWYGENNKPTLIIADILYINDNAHIKIGAETLAEWRKSVTTLDNIAKDSGVPVLYINYHNPWVADKIVEYINPLANLDRFNVLDMQPIYYNTYFPEQWTILGDGLHLSNLGNERYFAELDKLFEDVLS